MDNQIPFYLIYITITEQINGQSIDNMAYEEAQQLLKTHQSHLSLTVLKPSVSTASSHRSSLSLMQPLQTSMATGGITTNNISDDISLSKNTDNNNTTIRESVDSLASSYIDALMTSSTSSTALSAMQHLRSPSAPDFFLQHPNQQLHQIPHHVKSMTIIHSMSDHEIKKALDELAVEQVC